MRGKKVAAVILSMSVMFAMSACGQRSDCVEDQGSFLGTKVADAKPSGSSSGSSGSSGSRSSSPSSSSSKGSASGSKQGGSKVTKPKSKANQPPSQVRMDEDCD